MVSVCPNTSEFYNSIINLTTALTTHPDQEHAEELSAAEGLPDRQQPGRAALPPHGAAAQLRRLQGDRRLPPQARRKVVRPVPGHTSAGE